jgi:hypothetical protein
MNPQAQRLKTDLPWGKRNANPESNVQRTLWMEVRETCAQAAGLTAGAFRKQLQDSSHCSIVLKLWWITSYFFILRWQPLWSSVQSSWLQIQRYGFDSRCYHIFWQVLSLERGPLSLVSSIEELFGRNSSSSGLESLEYGRREPSRWPRHTIYPQKLALTSRRSGCRSVGIVRSRTQATDFVCLFNLGLMTISCAIPATPWRVGLQTIRSGKN